MSDNGKGSNTAKRTNFKKFNEGWDKIDWSKTDEPPQPPSSIQELQEEIDKVKEIIQQKLKENEPIQSEERGNNPIG